MKRIVLVLLAGLVQVGCATASGAVTTAEGAVGPDAKHAAAKAAVTAAVGQLPKCEAGAEVGQLSFAPTFCTEKKCSSSCCNTCGWSAKLETKGGTQNVDPAKLKDLLHLPDGALECEVAGWSDAVTGQSVGLSPACAVK